ncbi:hypothetical protein TNCV_13771 [Trichonephila clavipes]|nr:hypothetical protein TNCV_13771 [Trichonephila clavipes]
MDGADNRAELYVMSYDGMVFSTIDLWRTSCAWLLCNRPLSCPLVSIPPYSKVLTTVTTQFPSSLSFPFKLIIAHNVTDVSVMTSLDKIHPSAID